MSIFWLLALAAGLAGMGLLTLLRRRTQAHVWQEWGIVRGDVREAMVEWVRLHTSVHLMALGRALRVARNAQACHAPPAKVRRALIEADILAEQHVHFGRQRLARWYRVARPLATLHRLPALPVSTLHAPTLRRLAFVERLAAPLLSDSLRFLFGLRVLGLALDWVGWMFYAARRRAAHDDGLPRALGVMETGHDDFAALDARALTFFDGLLRSLPTSDGPR